MILNLIYLLTCVLKLKRNSNSNSTDHSVSDFFTFAEGYVYLIWYGGGGGVQCVCGGGGGGVLEGLEIYIIFILHIMCGCAQRVNCIYIINLFVTEQYQLHISCIHVHAYYMYNIELIN